MAPDNSFLYRTSHMSSSYALFQAIQFPFSQMSFLDGTLLAFLGLPTTRLSRNVIPFSMLQGASLVSGLLQCRVTTTEVNSIRISI